MAIIHGLNEDLFQEIRYRDKLEKSRLPVRFWEKEINGYEAKNKMQKEIVEIVKEIQSNMDEFLNSGEILVFSGSYGTGKTHIAASMIKSALRMDFSALYVKAPNLFREIKNTYSDFNKHELDIFDNLTSVDLLVVDELGNQFNSKNEKIFIGDVIIERYDNFKSTLLITNITDINNLVNILTPRVIDRIDKNNIFAFNWESYRGGQNVNRKKATK